MFPLVSDERLFTFVDERPPDSQRALEARYRAWATGLSPDGAERWLNWAARLRGTETFVGWFQATVRADRTAEIAYVVFAQQQKRGYAREACSAVIGHLVRDLRVECIFATVDPRNEASIALATSLGMRRIEPRECDLRFVLEPR